MPGFADSFWSGDYAGGLGVLFGKLQQGIIENQQVLIIARLRADAEELYGTKLCAIPGASDKSGGFSKDDGATTRQAFEGWKTEMEEAGQAHRKVAQNIRDLVITPFSNWCEDHADRVNNSHDELRELIRQYDKQLEQVRKLRSSYFNQCRRVEDMEEETKFIAVPAPVASDTPTSTTKITPVIKVASDLEKEDEELDPLEIGDEYLQPSQVKKKLSDMLDEIPLGEVKVAILGTYQNVATGEVLVNWIMKNWGATSVSYAERIGQDLVGNGFLRLVGNVGNTFANSSKMNYQFRPKAFQWAGVSPKPVNKLLPRTPTIHMNGNSDEAPSSPTMAYVGDYLGNLLSNQHPGETPSDKLRREAKEADARYKAGVRQLDLMRCHLEEQMIEHLKFMEKCELDRVKAIKAVILDFSGAISNVIPTLQKTLTQIETHQESILPATDLRYLIENYRTGSFVPKVVTYESYYNSPDEQTFGIDLEARARADRKRVPVVITSILTYLDHHYPDLEGDEARRGIWLVDVPLAATHHLRNAINNGKAPEKEILAKYEIPIVASVLKLYLLELPDSIVSSQKYEIIKTVYTTHGAEGKEEDRLTVIQSTLGTLPLTNIATLDAITTHFTRLIELTSADETFVQALAQSLTKCILRPRVESSLTQDERHTYRLVRDLFAYKDQIFGALKKASSVSGTRPRAVSTDESQRRAHVEARNRAVITSAKSRSSSPAAPMNRHGRGTSGTSDAAVTRFPINTSPTSGSPRSSRGFKQRDSLEVPGAEPPAINTASLDERLEQLSSADTSPPTSASAAVPEQVFSSGLEKKNSLSRTSHAGGSSRFPRRNANLVRGMGKRDSMASNASADGDEQAFVTRRESTEGVGVTLVDKPVEYGVTLVDKPMDY
ncbi:hypothetical protein FN846DRAFT_106230 [Sphaerosporella brunnea]|uniref:Rho-GTPase-activating protein 8 n=1 Tax=Sphaerosporella brunnea TaxID=1250544 RepID=A0A5J5ESP5_9PEZI|nr:hypothetical protein FN846DRAFT_106230 [Sphaerosporella brunnea]